jgi:hypothetical protein
MARRGADDQRLHGELERLYALPPAAFTGARNELAARLRREGRREAAAEVKALARPTASAWATSRLMRLEPARFRALLAAGGQARQAQRQVVGGGAAATAAAARLRDALRQARTLIEELRQRGLELLGASGRTVNASTADRLGADLQALAFTAGAESAIARGWLDHDLEAPGFEVLAGLQAAAGDAAKRASPRKGLAGRAAAREPVRRPELRQPEPRQAASRAEPRRGRAAEVEERPPRHGSAREDARARLLAARERQEQTRRERDRAFLQQARERQRARQAEAEAAVRQAAAESERLAAAAGAAEREAAAAESDAAAARRRASEARLEAERARRGADRARRELDRAGERLAAVRAAAAPEFKASAAGRPAGRRAGRSPGDGTR